MIDRAYIINSHTKKVIAEFERKGRIEFIEEINGSDYCKEDETIFVEIVTFGEYFTTRPKYRLDGATKFNLNFDGIEY